MDSQNLQDQSSDLASNASRFLIQQLNLDDQPNEEQIILRAEELDIQDFQMARESLTKQLEPQWKPFCNRKGHVFYINLQQRKAYVDHPIDMYYKKLYALKNQRIQPKFAVYKIEEVATSLSLIQQQIQAYYEGQQHQQGLNIVYEQSNQQNISQSINSHQGNKNEQIKYLEKQQQAEQQICYEQKQEQYRYVIKLKEHFEQQVNKINKHLYQKSQSLKKQHGQRIKQIVGHKIQQYITTYKEELKNKNKIDYQKQKLRLLKENQKNIQEYELKSRVYRQKIDEFKGRQAQLEKLYQCKQMNTKINMIYKLENEIQFRKKQRYHRLRDDLLRDFDKKIMLLHGSSKDFQVKLLRDLEGIWKSGQSPHGYNIKNQQKLIQGRCQQAQINENVIIRRPFFNSQLQPVNLKRQDQLLWSKQDAFLPGFDIPVINKGLSLCQRLQLRII